MRIGFVTPNYYPTLTGGSEVSLRLLSETLVSRGHTVLVLSFDYSPNRPQKEIINGVKVIRFKMLIKSALPLSLSIPVSLVMKSLEKSVDI